MTSSLRCVSLICLLAATPASEDLGFLGPRGTFSEEAADVYRRATPLVGKTIPLETMTALVQAVREGHIGRGIVPVASTVAGFPAESAGLLLASLDPGFRVIDEVVVPVELHLVVRHGTPRSRIRRIASHPSALKEARSFLRTRYAGLPLEETASTASAAERAATSDGSVAAIASAGAVQLYDLDILDAAIQESPDNATSFWVIARPDNAPALVEADRLVIAIDAPAGSPVLSKVVANLARSGFAVVFINSAPLPGILYGFRYLLSLAADQRVARRVVDSAVRADGAPGARVLVLGWFELHESARHESARPLDEAVPRG